jgi:hypothetical protein
MVLGNNLQKQNNEIQCLTDTIHESQFKVDKTPKYKIQKNKN